MTRLTKPVTRWTVICTDSRIQSRSRDEIAVTLYPGGFIGFRPKRHQKEYTLSLSGCYLLAIKAEQGTAKTDRKNRRHRK